MNYLPPIPASPAVLDFLLGLTFLLHLLFMNFVVAAPFIIFYYLLFEKEKGMQCAIWLSAALPVAFTFAINFGVPPLLFTQTLFTEQFYTANILLGTKWLAIIFWLLVAFYCSYLLKSSLNKDKPKSFYSGLLALVVGIGVMIIGTTMIGNYFISTSPNQWQSIQQTPLEFLRNPTFLTRSLHFLAGSFATTGFWMIGISWWRIRKEQESEDLLKLRQHGLFLATFATGTSIIVGIWFLLRLPTELLTSLFSGSVTSLLWMSSIVSALVLVGFLVVAALFPKRILWQQISFILLIYTLLGMIIGRDFIRISAFGHDFNLEKLPHASQGSPMAIFLLLLPLCLSIIGYLIWLVWRLPERKQS